MQCKKGDANTDVFTNFLQISVSKQIYLFLVKTNMPIFPDGEFSRCQHKCNELGKTIYLLDIHLYRRWLKKTSQDCKRMPRVHINPLSTCQVVLTKRLPQFGFLSVVTILVLLNFYQNWSSVITWIFLFLLLFIVLTIVLIWVFEFCTNSSFWVWTQNYCTTK